MICMVLRINHYEVVEAASGAAGLRLLDELSFDAAIVDIFLADTSGVDVITSIRERAADFPIVAVSGMTALDFVNDAPDLANVICLRKPFRPHELLAALKSAQAACAPCAARI